jgi:BatD DUF11 like domain
MRWLWISLALSCLLSAPASAQRARVSMSSSATRVTVGEPFAIEIRADVSGDDVDDIAVPDFGKLQVVGKRVSRPFSFSFGFGNSGQHARVESQIVHGYTLVATAPGTYLIQPAIVSVGGRKFASQRLSIEATGAPLPQPPGPGGPSAPNAPTSPQAAPPDGSLTGAHYDNDLFLRTVVDKTRAYVGEQVTATVYLYVRGALSQNPSITREPTTEGFWVDSLLDMNRPPAPVQQVVNGRTFSVYVLRRYAAFPLRAGKLEIGAPSIEVGGGNSLFDLITGPSAPVRRDGVTVGVEALELPARARANAPTHVGTLALHAALEPAQGKVGDAFTLRLSAKGSGNLKSLKLPSPQLDGVEVLAPEIEDSVSRDLDQVGGERVFRWLLLPRRPGKLTLAPFSVDVFDPSQKSFETVRSEPLKLEVSGKAQDGPAQVSQPGAPERSDEVLSFGPARTDSELARARPPLSSAPWFAWAVLAGPLGVLGIFAASRLAARLRARRAAQPGDQALRNAEHKLRDARAAARRGDPGAAYAGIVGALRASLAARLAEPIGGLTLQMLHAHCLARGMAPPLADGLVGELERCEQARFDPSRAGGASLEQQITRAEELLRQLARFAPRAAPGAGRAAHTEAT